jgi:hypothetical protein
MIHDRNQRGCEQARSRAVLAPDGELSMLELRLLRAHLGRCPSCARIASDIETITATIRAAPLEQLPEPINVPALKRSRFGRLPGSRLAGQLAAVSAGAVLAVTMGSFWSDETAGTISGPPIVIDETNLEAIDAEPTELRVYRHASLIAETPAAPRVGKHPGSQPL